MRWGLSRRACVNASGTESMYGVHAWHQRTRPAGRGPILRVDTAKSTSNFGFCERAARQHLRPLPAIHLRQSRRHTRVQLRACMPPPNVLVSSFRFRDVASQTNECNDDGRTRDRRSDPATQPPPMTNGYPPAAPRDRATTYPPQPWPQNIPCGSQ